MSWLYKLFGIPHSIEDIPLYAKKHKIFNVDIKTKITNEEIEGVNTYHTFVIQNSEYTASYTIYINGKKIRVKGKSLKNPEYEEKLALRKQNLEKALETAKGLQKLGINVKLNDHNLDEAAEYIEKNFKNPKGI